MLCSRLFPIEKKFMHKRGRKHQSLPLVIFCPTVSKHFVGEPFSVSLIVSIDKNHA